MATRYAGDYFGVSLEDSSDSSKLLEYFPGLRNTYKKKSAEAKERLYEEDPSNEPRLTGNLRAAARFPGFKTFEAPR